MAKFNVQIPASLFAAFDWIDAAGEWDQAFADPAGYALAATDNARSNDVFDVDASDLTEIIELVRSKN